MTDELLALDPSLEIHPESDWSGGEESKLYTAFNSGGIECETGEFIYSLIRLMKPDLILETGTHVGVGALYMALACQKNAKGKVVTIEFLPENFRAAAKRFQTTQLDNYIENHLDDVKNFYNDEREFELMLLDTEPQTRFEELLAFYPKLKAGGIVLIHDLHRHMGQAGINPDHPNEPNWPWGTLPKAINKLVKDGKLRPFHFSTPRGLTGFYKPTDQDYEF